MRTVHPTRAPISDLFSAEGKAILSVTDLVVSYGGIQAVKGISLEAKKGEIVALIGANGAGKSSTLRALAGLTKPKSGSLQFAGKDLNAMTPEDRVKAGVSLVPEGRAIFPNLTVRENLEIGAYTHRDRRTMTETMADVFELFPRLGERVGQDGGTLSGGEQQMLAIGRAMMARPALLLLDEPSLGIAPKLVEQIFAAIVRIAEAGVTVLVVEQNTRVALKNSARGYVLRTGELAQSGPSHELLNDEGIRKAYLGG
jgi:branched-chain amino acid transport system ATP-binding protein